MEFLWGLIVWLVVGAIIGWLASLVMGKNASMGLLANIIAGVLGAIVGGWLQDLLGIGGTGLVWSGLFAVLGAIIVIAIAGLFMRKPAV